MRSIAEEHPTLRYLEVADCLRERVIRGVYSPGDSLPSQSVFAKELGVYLETYRKALGVLIRDGYVLTKAGLGTYICAPEKRNRSALVVDDDGAIRAFLQKALVSRGWRCIHTGAGYAALAEMKNGRFDVIFLDLIMAGMSGARTFREIRQIDQQAHVVIMTADPGSPQVAEVLQIGMVSHKVGIGSYQLISKPFGLAELEAALARSSAAAAPAVH